ERAYNKILTENPGITPRDAYARYRTELAIEKINSYSTRAKNMLNTCVEGFKDFANKHCTIDNAIVAGACIIAGLSILGTASYLTGYHKPVIEFISHCF
ncbi:hypothetical protein KY328_01945, partial [Candidatus Woesearchaeota archaeon]|nr:hypothetical protein [Candidatus Woesearchaeota archaeon]